MKQSEAAERARHAVADCMQTQLHLQLTDQTADVSVCEDAEFSGRRESPVACSLIKLSSRYVIDTKQNLIENSAAAHRSHRAA